MLLEVFLYSVGVFTVSLFLFSVGLIIWDQWNNRR
jgi:hypothetical protein